MGGELPAVKRGQVDPEHPANLDSLLLSGDACV